MNSGLFQIGCGPASEVLAEAEVSWLLGSRTETAESKVSGGSVREVEMLCHSSESEMGVLWLSANG
jgi:hypothetical protein